MSEGGGAISPTAGGAPARGWHQRCIGIKRISAEGIEGVGVPRWRLSRHSARWGGTCAPRKSRQLAFTPGRARGEGGECGGRSHRASMNLTEIVI
eukprot:SAG11_NODE_278_length_11284_cov_202.732231_2_plen_95_part_00